MLFKDYSLGILNAGIANTDNTLVMQAGYEGYFPDPAINGSYPAVIFRSDYGAPSFAFAANKAEQILITAKSGTTYAIQRAYSGGAAINLNDSGKTYYIAAGVPANEMNKMHASLFGARYGNSLLFNGSSQYLSAAYNSVFDRNGSEMITASNDTSFESSIGNWSTTGNHSIIQSNTDKYSGTYSGKITASGTGDANNCAALPPSAFTTIASGKKYTLQLWARSSALGVSGTNIITGNNAAFDTGIGNWTSAIDGIAWDSGSQQLKITAAESQCRWYCNSVLNNSTTLGKTYRVRCTMFSPVSTKTPAIYNGNAYINFDKALTSSPQIFTAYITKMVNSNAFGQMEVYGSAIGDIIYFDNFDIEEIASGITLKIGSQSKSFSSISNVAGTFTKLIFNFKASVNETGQPIQIYSNYSGDVIYIDTVSLTQAYDRGILVWFKTSSAGVIQMICNRYDSAGKGIKFYINASGKLECFIDGATYNITVTGSTIVTDGQFHLAGLSIDAIGNMTISFDDVTEASADISGIGTISSTAPYQIGYYASDYFNGSLGEIQVSRFDDITSSNWAAINAYNKAIPKKWNGGNFLCALHLRYQSVNNLLAEMLTDLSGQNNTVSAVNMDITTANLVEESNYISRGQL